VTESRIPPNGPYGAYVGLPTPMWCCGCEVHWATTSQPLCPTCLDDRAKPESEKWSCKCPTQCADAACPSNPAMQRWIRGDFA
jgi:hypothetical protein